MNDAVLAAQLATEAGALLRRAQTAAAPHELGTQALKDRGDRESQTYLANALARHRPDDHVLSEEAKDSSHRARAERVWIIDPLDGTREFSEGRDDWAVHVALWSGGELSVGAVALPGLDLVLTSSDPTPPWHPPKQLRLAVSRTRATATAEQLAKDLGAELIPMGSAGYKVGAVVRGEADAYVHTGGQYEWDSAAPVAVARAAGLFTSRVNGEPLVYNNEDPYLPDLVVCNPCVADDLLEHITHTNSREQ